MNKPQFVAIDKLKITNAPFENVKARQHSKYEALFAKMKPGQAIEVPDAKDTPKVSTSLRKWLEKNEKPGEVKHNKACADGKARVWWIA